MTNQEIFDKVAKHLIKQGKQSFAGMRCAYRGPDGTKCAVGVLIPDELYNKAMEGVVCTHNIVSRAIPGVAPESLCFLRGLQVIHDQYEPAEWVRRLRDIAMLFKLSDEVLN